MILFNAKIYDYKEKDFTIKDIEIKDGKIVSIKEPSLEENNFPIDEITQLVHVKNNKQRINLKGLLVLPGGIDPHVHFDTPGFTSREDFFHGSSSSAAGGITTVIDMPCTSIPPVTSKEYFIYKRDFLEKESVVDYAFFGGVNGNTFGNVEKNFSDLKKMGVKGIKVYLISGMKTFERLDSYQLMMVLKMSKKYELPILVHAEDYDIISNIQKQIKKKGSTYLEYAMSRPEEAEINGVAEVCSLCYSTGGKAHIVHIGSYKAAKILEKFKELGCDITGETCPHYLAFSIDDFPEKGAALKTAPVVKTKEDSEKLLQLLEKGILDFLTSDHAPAPLKEKSAKSFWKAYGGIPGTQTLYLYLLDLYLNKKISLQTLIKAGSENAAKRYGLYPQKGYIAEGSDADFAIFDPNAEYTFRLEDLISKGETTPFEGYEFKGKLKATILRGEIIYHENLGVLAKKGYGKLL